MEPGHQASPAHLHAILPDASCLQDVSSHVFFPLPTSGKRFDNSPVGPCLLALCTALNSLNGGQLETKEKRMTPCVLAALDFLEGCVRDVDLWKSKFSSVNFKEFFKAKGVDYRGGIVRVAQSFSWEGVAPNLS